MLGAKNLIAIISIGDELLQGKVIDTNSVFIGRWLSNLGLDVRFKLTCKDEIKDIALALSYATKKANVIFLSGGLGPTHDDLTRNGVAEFLGEDLYFSSAVWTQIIEHFKLRQLSAKLTNKRQAWIINNAEIIPNKTGTAPGMFYQRAKQLFFILPGPPNENRTMLKGWVRNRLIGEGILTEYKQEILRVYGLGESQLSAIVDPLNIECPYGCYFKEDGWIELHFFLVSRERDDKSRAEINLVRQSIVNAGFLVTADRHISSLLLEELATKDLTLACSESITAGAISSILVQNPGYSKHFLGSIIAYSKQLKKTLLGVQSIDKFGAVSKESTEEMLRGLLKKISADIALAITGSISPLEEKESLLGTVFVSISYRGKMETKKFLFYGSRRKILLQASLNALIFLYKFLVAAKK